MCMMPRTDGPKPGPAGLARRGAVVGACVALLAVGCGSAGPGSNGRSSTSAASPGTAPGGGGTASPRGDAAALARGRWSVRPASPLGSRQGPVVAWTGRELLEIGGWEGKAAPGDGAAFDPADGRWRRIAPAPVPVGALAVSVWTGGWPQHQTVPPPLFTGSQILIPPGQIWCGACSHPFGGQPGLLVDPGTLRITRLPRGPLDDTGPVMVWTGGAALAINPDAVISGPRGNVRPGDMAAWDPASGAWRRLPGAPRPRQDDATPAWTGHELLAIASDGTLVSFTP